MLGSRTRARPLLGRDRVFAGAAVKPRAAKLGRVREIGRVTTRAHRGDQSLQTDPTGYDDGLNWYAYVGNDPLNKSDPDGKQSIVDVIIGVVHGSNKTVQVSASGDSTAGVGGTVSAGVYAGRGPNGDLRIGGNLTTGVQAGVDTSAGAGVTVINGDTSNVAGTSQQAQVGVGLITGTVGATTSSATSSKPVTSYAGVAVGVSTTPVTASAAKTITTTKDIGVPLSPTAAMVSAATTITNSYAQKIADKLMQVFK